MQLRSRWDHPGIADLVEAIWQSGDEVGLRRAVAEWMGPRTGKFLDLGCGTALMAPHFRHCQYYGVDGSREMLHIAELRTKAKSLTLCDFSTETLPFEDGFFDFTLCMQVLRHMGIEHHPHVLSELARVVAGPVFIHDIFYDGSHHIYEDSELGGQMFKNNTWALSIFLADLARYFPGREVRQRAFIGPSVGLEIVK